MSDAREVIFTALRDGRLNDPIYPPTCAEMTEQILAALDAAGWAVVRKSVAVSTEATDGGSMSEPTTLEIRFARPR